MKRSRKVSKATTFPPANFIQYRQDERRFFGSNCSCGCEANASMTSRASALLTNIEYCKFVRSLNRCPTLANSQYVKTDSRRRVGPELVTFNRQYSNVC